MDTSEIVGLLNSVLASLAYYRDPATDGGAVAITRVDLPSDLFEARAEVSWDVTVEESSDALIRYYVGSTHVGTQRPA